MIFSMLAYCSRFRVWSLNFVFILFLDVLFAGTRCDDEDLISCLIQGYIEANVFIL